MQIEAHNALWTGFTERIKTSFGEQAARKVLQRFKQMKLPKSGYKAFAFSPKEYGLLRGLGIMAAPGVRAQRTKLKQQLSALEQAGHGDYVPHLREKNEKLIKGVTSRVGPVVVQTKSFNRMWGPDRKRLDGKQKKMLEAVMKGHEIAETQAKPSPSMWRYGHISPDVILREHNMITTLPKGYEPVAELMRNMRSDAEAPLLKKLTGVDYGKGERFSRHARKRLTQMIERGVQGQGGWA